MQNVEAESSHLGTGKSPETVLDEREAGKNVQRKTHPGSGFPSDTTFIQLCITSRDSGTVGRTERGPVRVAGFVRGYFVRLLCLSRGGGSRKDSQGMSEQASQGEA